MNLAINSLLNNNKKITITIRFPSAFPIEKDLIPGDALQPLLFKFPLEYAIRKAP